MTIAPVIQRLHPQLDAHQREVVGHTGGPLLVVAGPGSGKTRCIERRAVNLLLLEEAAPGELVLCTFGRDAAGELVERFSASAQACGIAGAASGVRISTIHSLCHSILAPHAAMAGLRQDYELLDERRQHRLLHEEFGSILAPDWHILSRRGWRDEVRAAHEAGRYFDRICDDAIDVDLLMASDQPFAAALGRCCRRYRELLRGRNAVDFAHLQVWADRLLQDGDVAAAVAAGVRHLMVDEFQDTSRIQLRILKRLARAHGNFVVVGDDDQSIYRFRGASVANLLDFPGHFPGCRMVRLTTQYRSHRDIVASCNAWMDTAADWSRPGGAGQSLRFEKDIVAHEPENDPDYPAVIAVQGADPRDEGRRLGELLRFLKSNGVISSYGQVALLLHSVSGRHWFINHRSGPHSTQSPLDQSQLEALRVSQALRRRLKRSVPVAPALALPGMERERGIERQARRSGVLLPWELERYTAAMAEAEMDTRFRRPLDKPTALEEISALLEDSAHGVVA